MSLFDEIFGKPSSGINSKVKGNRNELILSKSLQEWTGVEFVRVPMSGGLRWKNLENICGDVICTDKEFHFPFIIETKHWKTYTTSERLRKNSVIYSIWRQVKSDADRHLNATNEIKVPLLFIRKNGMPKNVWHVVLSDEYFNLTKFEKPMFSGGNLHGFLSTYIFSIDYSKFLHTLWEI
jgi:hypothetical protein